MGYPQAIPNIPGSLGSPRIHFFSLAQPSPAHPCLAQPCLAQPCQLVAETKPTCGRNSPNGPPRLGLSAYIPRFLRGLPFQRHAWVRERKRAGFLSPLNNFPLRDRPESASVSERASCLYIYIYKNRRERRRSCPYRRRRVAEAEGPEGPEAEAVWGRLG